MNIQRSLPFFTRRTTITPDALALATLSRQSSWRDDAQQSEAVSLTEHLVPPYSL
jgi:hypothetical protein